jgi:hypothetical protein
MRAPTPPSKPVLPLKDWLVDKYEYATKKEWKSIAELKEDIDLAVARIVNKGINVDDITVAIYNRDDDQGELEFHYSQLEPNPYYEVQMRDYQHRTLTYDKDVHNYEIALKEYTAAVKDEHRQRLLEEIQLLQERLNNLQ